MFGGIIENMVMVKSRQDYDAYTELTLALPDAWDDLSIGDSVSVNGICLTATRIESDAFYVSMVPETLRLVNCDDLMVDKFVNVERALKASSRIGGHYVQGHIDGTGTILELTQEPAGAMIVKISIEPHLAKYIVNKGYIGLDGMSITIIEATDTWFTITLIPHTQQVTISQQYAVGKKVNIEVDIMGKYIEKLIAGQQYVKA